MGFFTKLFPDFKQYIIAMSLARRASEKSNCQKTKVGACIINKKKIVAVGCNTCNPKDGVCRRLHTDSTKDYELCGPPIHAEATAIANMLKHKPDFVGRRGNKMYIWGHTFSCDKCQRAIKINKIDLVAVTNRKNLVSWIHEVGKEVTIRRRIVVGVTAFVIGTFGSYLLVSIL